MVDHTSAGVAATAARDYFSVLGGGGGGGRGGRRRHEDEDDVHREYRLVTLEEDPRDPLSIDYLLDHTDWSATRLGPRESWPQSLKTALSMVLGSRQQAALWWGKIDKIMLYNAAYSKNISVKHPRIFGKPGAEAWAEVWDTLGEIGKLVVSGKTMSEENEMFLFR
jgi:hypothetical protein